jgi:hypothetical protein
VARRGQVRAVLGEEAVESWAARAALGAAQRLGWAAAAHPRRLGAEGAACAPAPDLTDKVGQRLLRRRHAAPQLLWAPPGEAAAAAEVPIPGLETRLGEFSLWATEQEACGGGGSDGGASGAADGGGPGGSEQGGGRAGGVSRARRGGRRRRRQPATVAHPLVDPTRGGLE